MEVMEAIRARSSFRRYKEDPVSWDLVLHVLEAARLAPSWHNKQGFFFLVLTDERRKLLADCLYEANPARNALLQAPVSIVLCADPAQSGSYDGKEYYMVDAACAMENLMLAAIEKGLGTCWVAGGLNDELIKKNYGIPENLKVVAITPLGYPSYQPKPRPRKSLQELTFLNSWGNGIS
ncbi:MAG: nitroreductase family protein [Bacillota bacterium]